MTFKEWESTAEVENSFEFGHLGRSCRDVYNMLGQTIFVETTFPWSCFKNIIVTAKAVDFNIKENDPIILLAAENGGVWEEGYYAEEGYGWPAFTSKEDEEDGSETRKCFEFIQKYQEMKKRKDHGLT